MSPLMLFMSSSLNVELVYTILYGIGKFTLLNFMRNEFTKEQMEQFKAMEYRVDRYGDTTITIREIVINNIHQWNNVNYDDIFQEQNYYQNCTVFENHRKSLIQHCIASEASYVYILSEQKLIKNTKKGPFWRVFENLKIVVKQCYQTCEF